MELVRIHQHSSLWDYLNLPQQICAAYIVPRDKCDNLRESLENILGEERFCKPATGYFEYGNYWDFGTTGGWSLTQQFDTGDYMLSPGNLLILWTHEHCALSRLLITEL